MMDDTNARPSEGSPPAAGAALSGRFAILGWGSLIWDLDDLAPHVALPWAMRRGPRLPLEFSRVSPKRRMSLVVVLDPDNGEDCATHAVPSRRGTVAEAALDLMRRERAKAEAHIGAVCRETGLVRSVHAEVGRRVLAWCEATGARGAVWTDLPRNFQETTGKPFSLDAAVAYLAELTGDSLAEAKRYIGGAPPETDTPLRRRLRAEGWLPPRP